MAWPDHFPENCPPTDGANARGDFFRFVDNNPPVADDFRSYYHLKPGHDWGDKLCQSCGLSVFRDIADLRRMQKRAKGKRQSMIARGTLTFGTVKHTDPKPSGTHHTWWVPEGSNPVPLFRIV